jgi:hypothetical protein
MKIAGIRLAQRQTFAVELAYMQVVGSPAGYNTPRKTPNPEGVFVRRRL